MANLNHKRGLHWTLVQITVSEQQVRLTCPLWTEARVHENPSTGYVAAFKRVLAEKGEHRQVLGSGAVTGQVRVSNANLRTMS